MVVDAIFASVAVVVTAARPRSWWSAAATAALAAVAASLGRAALAGALAATGPTLAFLLVAVLAAALVVRLGLAAWLAERLARAARGRPLVLFVCVCVAAAGATAALSLDGAVVLLVPVVVELARRFGAPLRALLLGVVVVANAFSLGLPEANPTNLVVLARHDLGFGTYAERALPAAAAAAVVCAAGVAVLERRSLRPGAAPAAGADAAVRVEAAVASVLRLGVQLSALLCLLVPIGARVDLPPATGLPSLLATAAATAAAAALANNLPASAAVAAVLAGPAAYAALAGVSVGALASEHGSVATLLAADLAGAPAFERRLVPVVAAALALAVVLLARC